MKNFNEIELMYLIAAAVLFMFGLLFLACVLVYYDAIKEYNQKLKNEQQSKDNKPL